MQLLFHDVSRAGLVTATEAAAAIGMIAGIATEVSDELLGQEEGEERAGTRNTSEYACDQSENECENLQKASKSTRKHQQIQKTRWTELCRSNTILKRHQLIGIGQAKHDQMQYFLRRFLGSSNGPACGLVQVVSEQGSNMQ